MNAKFSVDLAMLAAMLMAMGYPFWGKWPHRAAGLVLLALALAHIWQHRSWWASLRRGKYAAVRRLFTAVNLLLLAAMLALLFSGLTFLGHWRTAYWLARPLHMLGSYWMFVLAGLHLGVRADMWLKRLPRWAVMALAAVAVYGACAFVARGFPGYMLLTVKYAKLDYGELPVFFYADYLAVLVAGAALGHGLKRLALKG